MCSASKCNQFGDFILCKLEIAVGCIVGMDQFLSSFIPELGLYDVIISLQTIFFQSFKKIFDVSNGLLIDQL